MEYLPLGKTGIDVSKICLGTMTFGEQNTEAEGHEQLDYAVDQGINFIDTAELYAVPPRKETQGSTEKIVGTWLKKRKKRDDLILATKITGPGSHVSYIREKTIFSKKEIFEAIDNSLIRLQTDYVDLYQLHWPARKTNFFGKLGYSHQPNDPWNDNFLEILEAMDSLIKEGKIRHFGVSNETPWGVMHLLNLAELHNLPRCASIQNPYSLLNRTFEIGLAEISIREHVSMLAYSPLAFGLLSGKYITGDDKPTSRVNQFKQLNRYNDDLSLQATKKYYDVAVKYGINMTKMALAYVNTRSFMTSNIIGATTMAQLIENIDSIKFTLEKEVIEEIEAIHTLIPNPAP